MKVDQANFLGYGQTISLAGQSSSMRKSINLNLIEPYFLDKELYLNVGFYYNQFNYEYSTVNYVSSINQNSYGFNVTFGKSLSDYLKVYAGYKLSQVDIGGINKSRDKRLFRDLFTSALIGTVSYDSRNDRMFPTSGIYGSLSTDISHKYLGSDENILGYSYNFRFYQSLLWDIIFKTNLQGSQNIVLAGDILPFSERYRLGGIYSIRGYTYSSIGPTEDVNSGNTGTGKSSNFTIGGDKKLVINNELIFPLVKEMRINSVLFLDIGNTWYETDNMFYYNQPEKNKYDLPAGMYWSWGFGFRWITPMAPLSFEWGFPLTPRPGDEYTFEFNIKQSF